MTDFARYPAVNADAGHIYTVDGSNWLFSNQPTDGSKKWITVGDFLDAEYKLFVRFPNITIPKGAIINSVSIKLYITNYWVSYKVDSKIRFEDANNPSAVGSVIDYNYRNKTTNYKDETFDKNYDPSGWYTISDSGGDYGLRDAVQEVIDRSGWANGNSMQIFITPYSSSNAAVHFWATYDGNYDSMQLLISYTYSLPDAPSGISVSRVSDTSHYISWTNNPDTGKPYTSVILQRSSDDFDTYTNIELSSSTSSYTDNTTSSNNKYKWRVKARNDAGDSSYNTSSEVKTTPAVPTNLVAQRTSGNTIDLSWTNNSDYADSIIVEKAIGPTYSSWSAITASPLSGSAVYSQEDESNQVKFRTRSAVTYSSLSSTNVVSNACNAPAAPNAPSNLAPSNNDIVDCAAAYTFSWQHNSNDTSIQTKYSLRYQIDGGAWTDYKTEEASSTQSLSIPASTFVTGNTYNWQVKTWGVHATGSDWSDSAVFLSKTKPTGSITSPADSSEYGDSELTVSWTYYDADSDSQEQALIELYDSNDVLLSSGNIYGTATSYTFENIVVENGSSYKVKLYVKDPGLWSEVNISEFDVVYDVPPKPQLYATYNINDGGCHIEIVNPTPGGAEVATSYNKVYKSVDGTNYELLYDDVTPNTTIIDYTPLLQGITYYYAIAVSTTPTTNIGLVEQLNNQLTGGFFINGGNNFSTYQKLISDIDYDETRNRNEVLKKFEGRSYPVKYQGVEKDRIVNFTCDLLIENYDNLINIIEGTDDIFYRDWRGRHFKCSISSPKFKMKDNSAYQFSCVITQVS